MNFRNAVSALALMLALPAIPWVSGSAMAAPTGACGVHYIAPGASSYTAAQSDDGSLIGAANATGAAVGWAAASLPVALPDPATVNTNWTVCGASENNKAIVFNAPLLAAPATPVLSQTVGGSQGARTRYVKITFTNLAGETVGSAESSLAVSANNLLVVGAPASSGNATGWNVYVGTASGNETKQNASPLALGTNWTEPLGGLISGSSVPSTGTAPLAYILSGDRSLSTLTVGPGNYQYVTIQSDNANYRVVQANTETLAINGATSKFPARTVFPGGPGYQATQGDNGNVISSGLTSGGLALTLPSIDKIAAGWTIMLRATPALPMTVAQNSVNGGSTIIADGTAVSGGWTLSSEGPTILQFDGANFVRILSGASGADLRQFGASVTSPDNSAALQAGIAWAQANHRNLLIPEGTFAFQTPPICGAANNWGIIGAGGHVSELKYTGANTSNDLIACGSAGTDSKQVSLKGFRIWSGTVMTGGAALHLKRMVKPRVDDVVPDGEYGNGNLWHGIWWDWVVNGGQHSNVDARGQCDAVRVNTGADLAMFGNNRMRYSGTANTGCAGLHIGGGFGGIECLGGDIIQNARNLLIDNAIDSTLNRELFFHSGCTFDTASVDDNIQINETSSGSARTLELWGYNSGAARDGIRVISWPNSTVTVHGKVFLNGGNGINILDNSTSVRFAPSADIRGNSLYGINCAAANTILGIPIPKQNVIGDIHSNCVVEAFSGYTNGVTVTYRNSSPEVAESATYAGQVAHSVLNNSTDPTAYSQTIVGVGASSNTLEITATNGNGSPFAEIKSGPGATGGISLNAQAGPVKVSNGAFRTAVKTVSSLPSCTTTNAGDEYWVSDALSPAWNGTLTGGGASQVRAVCNGANWTAH